MKKYIYTALALAVTMLTACTGDYTDWADPQHNDQPATVAFGDGSVTEVGLIDFADDAVASSENVKVCSIVAPTASDAAYTTASYKLNLGETSYDITADGTIPTADFKAYLESNYGKAPVERDIKATVEQWISNGSTTIKTATSSEFIVKGKLTAPTIYDHLYLIGGVEGCAWETTSTAMPFTHSETNVYDDPVFTITVPVAEGETWFAITDDKTVASGSWDDVIAPKEGNGNNVIGTEGYLGRRGEFEGGNNCSFKIAVDGDAKYMKITCNMLEGTYKIEKINFADYFYEIGGESSWSTNHALYGPNADGKYSGYYYLNGEFKFKPNENDWNDDLECIGDWQVGQGSANCPDPGAGLYKIDLDVSAGTYALTPITSLTLIGSAVNGDTSWGTDSDPFTWDSALGAYTLTYTVTAGDYKIRANKGWDISWGGELSSLTTNSGANLSITAGTYKFVFTPACDGKATLTVTAVE